MAETTVVVDKTVEEDKAEQLAFSAGFTTDTPLETVTAKVDAPVVVEAKPEPKPEPKVEPKDQPKVEAKPVQPKYVQVTQEDFDSLKAAAAKVTGIEGQLSKAFGTIGNVQQLVTSMQSTTAAGQLVELPSDAFAEMRKDFPELADKLQADMAKLFKGIRGTAPISTQKPTVAPEEVQKLIDDALVKAEFKTLNKVYPKWSEIVGAADPGKADPTNAFRLWLSKQPLEYQNEINGTLSPAEVREAIDRFQAATKATAKPATPKPIPPKAVAQQNRIREAIQPKGDGGQPAPSKTIVDEFHAGFANR